MKKSLLFGLLLGASAVPALAVEDGFKYEDVNGFTCKSVWVDDRTSNMFGWQQLPFSGMAAKARTACLAEVNGEDYIVVGWSKTDEIDGVSNDYAHLVFINFANGNVEKDLLMTCDGAPISGLLCANQVGCDNFGNLWFCGYVASVYAADTDKYTPVNIYKVDDLTTGACTKVAALTVDPSEASDVAGGRVDYVSIVGDITRKEAGCSVMSALASIAPSVIAWHAEQGSDTWEGALDGYNSMSLVDTYPADQTSWGTAPYARIVLDEDYSCNLFYVDGFTTCPSLYDVSGALLDSFANATELAPKVGTNGVSEMTLAGKNFMIYSVAQYDATPGCQIRVVELGEGMAFDGMQSYWLLPENGLGEVSDGGTRIHSVDSRIYPDAAGKEGAYVLTYKCNNGLGVYAIGEEGWEDPKQNGVENIEADSFDAAAPVEYFNLQGVAVDGKNLPAGLYITRQGKTVNKVVVK